MRLLLFLFFLPSLAMAQPAMVPPQSVAGYIRGDLDGVSGKESVVLIYDQEGVIDLYIFGEASAQPLVYIPYFSASARNPPILRLLPDKSFTMRITGTSGIGFSAFAKRMAYQDGAYVIVGILNEFYPNTGGEALRCAYDLERGMVTITRPSGEVLEIITDIRPLPLDGNLPQSLTDNCVE